MFQKGFGAVEFIASLLLIVILGITCWYVYDHRVSAQTQSRTTSQTGQKSQNLNSLKVVRTSSGGLVGKGDGHNFTIADSYIDFNNTKKALTQDQLKTIAEKVDRAHFFSLNYVYRCQGCSDQFGYSLSITLDATSRTVKFEDSSDAPASLLDLDNYLVNLAK